MRRLLFIGGIVVAALVLAALGAVISLVRSVFSLSPSPLFERSSAR